MTAQRGKGKVKMCEWGNDIQTKVTMPADLSYTGQQRVKVVGIDECIAPIVAALEAAGIMMRYSCCGHMRGPGEIVLQDGRRLVVETSLGESMEGRLCDARQEIERLTSLLARSTTSIHKKEE